MAQREPRDFSTPTPEQLQAWFDLPSEPQKVESLESPRPASGEVPSDCDPQEAGVVAAVKRHYNAVAALDLLYDAAACGSQRALERISALEETLLPFASEIMSLGYSGWGAYRSQ